MVKLEYVKISLAFGIALITTYIYLLIFKHANKDILIKSLLTTILTITFYLSYLKLSHIPVDTFILAVQFIITSIFVLAIVANRDSEILLVIGGVAMFGVVALLGTGFLALFGQGMIALIAFSKLTHLLSKWYIDNIRKI